MRKEFIFIAAVLSGFPLVIFFMMQNTRFEENILLCANPKNIFKITYAQLENGAAISFEKNEYELKEIIIDKIENESFYFKNKYSDYKINLIELRGTETLKNKTQIYKCKLKKFKM